MKAKELSDFIKVYFSNRAIPTPYPEPVDFDNHEIIFMEDGVVVDGVAIPDELDQPFSEFDDETHFNTIWLNASSEERAAVQVLMMFKRYLVSLQIEDGD